MGTENKDELYEELLKEDRKRNLIDSTHEMTNPRKKLKLENVNFTLDLDEDHCENVTVSETESNKSKQQDPVKITPGDFDSLPSELWIKILDNLHPRDLMKMFKTSECFRKLIMTQKIMPKNFLGAQAQL